MSKTALRFPGYAEGDDFTGEPSSWLIYDKATGEKRRERNPNYVPPPPPTEFQLAEWDVRDAEHKLDEAKAWLAEVQSKDGETT